VFDEWAKNRSISSIVLSTANQPLAECIRLWCMSFGVDFKQQQVAQPQVPLSWVKRVYQATPNTLQALAWLVKYLIDRWPLKGVGIKEWRQTHGHVTFFSYSANWVPAATKQGRYESRYWAHLSDTLQREGLNTNWLHLYVKDESSPTPQKVAETICAFNNKGLGVQCHVTLDTFLSFSVFFRTLLDWCRLLWVGTYLRNKSCFKQRP
jgi:surface carbohydrate biosynthesis protein (TIGR04326 family)